MNPDPWFHHLYERPKVQIPLQRVCEWALISQQMSTVEIVHYFQNGFHYGHLLKKNLDFMDFLCISLGWEKKTTIQFYFPKCKVSANTTGSTQPPLNVPL